MTAAVPGQPVRRLSEEDPQHRQVLLVARTFVRVKGSVDRLPEPRRRPEQDGGPIALVPAEREPCRRFQAEGDRLAIPQFSNPTEAFRQPDRGILQVTLG